MLIRVSVANFRSFDGDTEFNMLSSPEQRTHTDHIYKQTNNPDLLKVAALYGANGAGKSNLVKAIALLRHLVLQGGKQVLGNVEPFKLAGNSERPTTFEIEYIRDGAAYIFGLSVQDGVVLDESLYMSGLGKVDDKVLFHRRSEGASLQLDFAPEYVATDEGKFRQKFYQNEFLKDDTLLFRELARLKEGFDNVKQAYEWFREDLMVIFPGVKPTNLVNQLASTGRFKRFADELLCSFHTGVDQMAVQISKTEDFFGQDDKEFISSITQHLKSSPESTSVSIGRGLFQSKGEAEIVLENGEPVVKQIITRHKNQTGELIDFTTSEESDGTNRLMDFIPAFYEALYGGPATKRC